MFPPSFCSARSASIDQNNPRVYSRRSSAGGLRLHQARLDLRRAAVFGWAADGGEAAPCARASEAASLPSSSARSRRAVVLAAASSCRRAAAVAAAARSFLSRNEQPIHRVTNETLSLFAVLRCHAQRSHSLPTRRTIIVRRGGCPPTHRGITGDTTQALASIRVRRGRRGCTTASRAGCIKPDVYTS